ncbi:MAG: hypothetical protein K0S23_423 [Fluviicola sp.]|jgi:hypothetical protein|uniref:hypothetical protein n=1 Tax=Fluviicola sp. TaxID=1917219 RepID=UPI002616D061|nr:hypothetical protein [Fluviicola sp.]MDF3026116.1 hypothetical protein [Fluviicola sp.]
MNKFPFQVFGIIFLQVFFSACGENPVTTRKNKSSEEEFAKQADSSFSSHYKKSAYDDVLKKFKIISFDTLKVFYDYENNLFEGKELTSQEAKFLPMEIYHNYNGQLSGVFACYQFEIDSTRIGLIARTPSEYESSSVKLFIFDTERDKAEKNYIELGQTFGDAGDGLYKASWLFKTKKKEIHSLGYRYQSYDHSVDDPSDSVVEEWRDYYLINCMSRKMDTISTDEAQLKKRFKKVLLTEE